MERRHIARENRGRGNSMTARSRRLARLLCGALVLCAPALGSAQYSARYSAQSYVYPERGQSAQQQEFDRGQCYSWAVQQSGFDPANPQVASAPPPSYQQPTASPLRGAAGGAALGAVGGAIGGDAGKGAAIGAGVGFLFGGMRRMRQEEEQQQAQQQYEMQQDSMLSQGKSNYDRAFAACMAGRGYTVR
jgi:type II secretory pathway pseudopilin PulG